ncbi:MAG: Na+/H+ antiporter subunit E [Pseudomonadota bacterium]|nr:Na+/H+ antiporter subunit E [Pseudomonadota bacterium]
MDHPQTTRTVSGAHYAFVFSISLLLWVLLSGSLAWEEVVLGAFVSLMITLLFGSRFTIYNGIKFSFMAPLYVLLYLLHFFKELIKANFELAMRVLTPSLPIRPQMVEIKTTLKSPLGRMLLANSITLTPGTLSVDVTGDTILVHWVYCPPGTDAKMATDAIAASFERHIKRFLK